MSPSSTATDPLSTASESSSVGRIQVRGLTRRFGDHVALSPTDLDVGRPDEGSITGLLGPNGSGKSTLMRMLTGLVRPDAGEAFVDGIRLSGDGTAIRKRCSYSPGELSIYDEMRGDEHLRWFLRGRDAGALGRARELAGRFELPLKKTVRSYSHGMKRQLLFASALAPDVRVRILDEPTEGLDPSRRAQIVEALQSDAASGTTVLLSSHHLGEVERLCDELVFINAGKVLSIERAEQVDERRRSLMRATFDDEAQATQAENALSGRDSLRVARHGTQLTLVFTGTDPRPLLEELSSNDRLPAPRSLNYGDLSLEELYRDLYGVEGV